MTYSQPLYCTKIFFRFNLNSSFQSSIRLLRYPLLGNSWGKVLESIKIDLQLNSDERGYYLTVNQPFMLDEYGEDSDPFGYENNNEDQKRLAILLDVMPLSKFTRVLDLGCGNGFITSNILNADEVIGIDVSPKAVDLANSRFKTQGRINHVAIKRNILTEEVDDLGKFDLIIATGVFYTHYLGFNHKIIEKKCNYLLNDMGFLISTHIREMSNVVPSQNFIMLDRLIYDYKTYTHEILVQRKIR